MNDLDSELDRLVKTLEEAAEEYASRAMDEATKESSYKATFHRSKLYAIENGDTVGKAESKAYVASADKLSEWNQAKALLAGQKELLGMLKTRIDVCRTLAANQRLI